jgi:hypothetical protein
MQTQITGITRIKPGRAAQLRAVLGMVKTAGAESPIARIGTIHFARWVLIDDDTRLLFTSNFDGSWEEYIDAFVDEAPDGFDAIWSNCEGYPDGGCRDRAAFKAYIGRHSFPATLYYSAYPDATVKEVRRALRTKQKFDAFLEEFQ